MRIEGFRLRKGFAGTRCTCSARLSQRNVLKPEAANEARREIARNAPPQQRFSQKNETITKNNEAKRKIPDGQIYLPKSGVAFCRDCVTILGKKDKKNGISNGIRQGGRSPTKSRSVSDGNPQLSEQSHFLHSQKITKQKEKATTGK